ncbi:MAG TPA: DUF72 domain-containing protein [Chryseosolibacter sp.]|nr:DUF72 domain-containing protein [Chryseosolibacter sp.]
MIQWKVGCSGYHYDDWKRIFYPEDLAQKKWFEFYTTRFSSLELNVTFYRIPKVTSLQNLANRTPANFAFTVKAPRLITHYKRLSEAREALTSFYETVKEGFGDKLGCILFQFPSSFVYEEHRLERIVNLVDPSMKNVVEFRSPTWWIDSVYKGFTEKNITFCSMSHPNLPDNVIQTSNILYYRFHGVPFLYSSRYESSQLETVAQQIQSLSKVSEAYIYFNNTAEAAAVINARQFSEICEAVSH